MVDSPHAASNNSAADETKIDDRDIVGLLMNWPELTAQRSLRSRAGVRRIGHAIILVPYTDAVQSCLRSLKQWYQAAAIILVRKLRCNVMLLRSLNERATAIHSLVTRARDVHALFATLFPSELQPL